MKNCCKERTERLHKKVAAMSHEDRLKLAKTKKSQGMGMVVAGCGCFGGLVGGLWSNMGAAALGVGFGGASGLWFGSCGFFEEAKMIMKWDEEIVEAGGDDSPPVVVVST